MASKKMDPWIRLFNVDTPSKHKNGYTVYKITSIVFPHGSPEAESKVVVWKRFKEIQQLHHDMETLHSQLHLGGGSFPPFPKPSFLNRFQTPVIEERRDATLKMLQFVAAFRPLFTSPVFTKFFQTSNTVEEPNEESLPELILPEVPTDDPTAQNHISETETPHLVPVKTTYPSDTSSTSSTGTGSSISRSCSSEDHGTESEEHVSDDAQVPTSPVCPIPQEILELDPLRPSSDDKNIKNYIDDLMTLVPSEDDIHAPWAPLMASINGAACEESDLLMEQLLDEVRLDDRYDGSKTEIQSTVTKEKEDKAYLELGCDIVVKAMEMEAAGKLQDAFLLFQDALEILLQGIKDETDLQLATVVKKKVAVYLQHAEKLNMKLQQYSIKDNILPEEHTKSQPKQITTVLCPRSLSADCQDLRGSIQDMGNLHIAGVEGPEGAKRMLVIHKQDPEQKPFLLKVICKSPSEDGQIIRATRLPISVPFMVHLERYYETEDAVYMLVPLACGGRLFDVVLSSPTTQPFSPPTDVNSTYTGKRLDKTEELETSADTDHLIIQSRKLLRAVSYTLKTNEQAEGHRVLPSPPLSPVHHTSPLLSIKKWAAQLVLALSTLHNQGIIWCDMHQGNLLLDEESKLLLTYHCQWGCVDEKPFHPWSLKDNFVAPELLLPPVGSLATPSCDWWSFGAILFFMLVGKNVSSYCGCPVPFRESWTLTLPESLSSDAASLLSQLLQPNPEQRIDVTAIKTHPFFSGINWQQLH